MTAVWALTWLGQSAALAVLTAACVRLPGLRTSAAARHAAWASALVLVRRASRVAVAPGGSECTRVRCGHVCGWRPGGGSGSLRRASGGGGTGVRLVRLGVGPRRGRRADAGLARRVAGRAFEATDRAALDRGVRAAGGGAVRHGVEPGSARGLVREARLAGGAGVLPPGDRPAARPGGIPVGHAVSDGPAPRTGARPTPR